MDGFVKSTHKEHKADKYEAENLSRTPGDRWFSMTHALTNAGHGLSLSEKRLIVCAASKLDSKRTHLPGSNLVSRITAHEYAETFEVDENTAYDQLKSAADKLFDREITFYQKNRSGAPIKTKIRWVGKAVYNPGTGTIELHWWHEVLQHLTGIKGKYTTYQLQQTSALRSAYSWKLLELLMQYKDKGKNYGWAQYSIDDFSNAMEATEKQRKDFAAIRRRIIEPAVKELVEKDGWLINWHPIKAGRKVTGLRFQFERNPQGRLALE